MNFAQHKIHALCLAFGAAAGFAAGAAFGPGPSPLPENVTLIHDNGKQEAFIRLEPPQGGMSSLIIVDQGEGKPALYGSFGHAAPAPK